MADGKTLATLTGHAGPVSDGRFSSDDCDRVATGSADQSVRFWEAASGRELQENVGHTCGDRRGRDAARQQVGRLGAGPTSPSGSGAPAAVRVFAGHQGPIFSVAVTPDGAQVVTASADKSIKVFEVNNRQCRSNARRHTGAVRAVAVTKDGAEDRLGLGRQDVPGLERG